MDASDRRTLATTLVRGSALIGLPLTDSQVDMCAKYADLMLDYNQHTNLTRITEPAEMAIKHFVDSLTVLVVCAKLPIGSTVADVGTGAGFPGLVLKIVRPDLKVTLIDSLGKRLTFLAGVVDALGLENVMLTHVRAEDAGRRPGSRDAYDLVTARAVAALPILLEWCCPLVRVGGRFVAMKSAAIDAELAPAAEASRALGCRLESDNVLTLPAADGDAEAPAGRRLLVYVRDRPTPVLYPRSPSTIKAHPLGETLAGERDSHVLR